MLLYIIQTRHWQFVMVTVHLKATNLDMSDLPKLKVITNNNYRNSDFLPHVERDIFDTTTGASYCGTRFEFKTI